MPSGGTGPAQRSIDLARYLSIQARANRLANRRLHAAMAGLGRDALHAERTSFFPTLARTLNHILAVDLYYIGALHREPGLRAAWHAFVPADDLAALASRQAAADERLIAWCDAADTAALDAVIEMERADHVQRERACHVLAHLLSHQVHHRGQVHAMLAGTAVKPPQLDEFMMPSEAALRVADMSELGWDEAAIYGPAA